MILFWMNDLIEIFPLKLSEYTINLYIQMGMQICRNRRPKKHLDEIQIWRMI